MVSMVGGVMGLGPDTVKDGAGEALPLPFVGDLASLPFPPLPIAFCWLIKEKIILMKDRRIIFWLEGNQNEIERWK